MARKLPRILPAMYLYGPGFYSIVQADTGLAPWEAFKASCPKALGMPYGDFVLLSGLVNLCIDVLLKEKTGIGTVSNTIMIGKVVDVLQFLKIMPKVSNFYVGIVILLIGQFIICFATYLYISDGLGSDPRNSLMVALGKRIPAVPIGTIRGLLEGTVLLIDWVLGAKVGLGTVLPVQSISLIMPLTFK
ncbi:MAG: hypothetical protein GX123_00455 [Clostridiales bacterium]|jgi:uncharacterized membrane protein YczE|nr:hypothetical protein [Clostridiales bacterium]